MVHVAVHARLIVRHIPHLSLLTGTLTRATSNKKTSDFLSIWDIHDTYKIKVLSAKNANTPENLKVHVYIILFMSFSHLFVIR